jgi:nitrogen regulatory protein PII 1
MKMIKAVIRPEKISGVMTALSDAGFGAGTRFSVLGRGKQQGIKIGDVFYSEIPKELLMVVVEDTDAERVTGIIADNARTGEEGAFGDGKIFILEVEKAITISSGKAEL